MAGEVEHRRLAVAQDPQQAQLGDREVVRGGDLGQRGLDRERELDDRVDSLRSAIGRQRT